MAATYLYGRISHMSTKHRLQIEGVWGEYVSASTDHQFTLGHIYFDKRKKQFSFDGTNYANSGEIFCHFATISSKVDVDARKFLYMFSAEMPGKMEVYFGFGVVNLSLSNGILRPSDGHYVSASVDGTGMAHTMVALPDLTYVRDAHGGQFIRRMRAMLPEPAPQEKPGKKLAS
jgi:hypothetical protein